jgi:histidyl-tRNA synthetase
VPIGDKAELLALKITNDLRIGGHHVDLGFGGSLHARMKRANKLNACAALIIGEDELARDAATVRDLDSGEQTEVPLAGLADHLTAFRK